jgi:hypothetical protein
MKVVYIAHPLGKGVDRGQNRERASLWVCWAGEQGVAPIADWIILSGRWSEDKRDAGLAIDFALIERCDELWLCGTHVSPGMGLEKAHAEKFNIPIRDMRYAPGSPGDPSYWTSHHG